jgi:glucose/arabinose dehydrogenase
MAVQVTGVGGAAVSIQRVDQHPTASTIFVEEGHLYVATGWSMKPHQTLAVYAPGEWRSAEVVDGRPRGAPVRPNEAVVIDQRGDDQVPVLHGAGRGG